MMDFTRFTSLENVKFHPYAEIFPHMYGIVIFLTSAESDTFPHATAVDPNDAKRSSGKQSSAGKPLSASVRNIIFSTTVCTKK